LPRTFRHLPRPETTNKYLRRPISVCNVDDEGMLWLLVRDAGAGTHTLVNIVRGRSVNLLLPLGHGFTTGLSRDARALLVGGGVGVAPLLYLGRVLASAGVDVHFLLGARSKDDLLLLDEFKAIGRVSVSTDDGSEGTPGVVTLNPAITEGKADMIYCCGPMPMMKAVAAIARSRDIACEVSLENEMACGLGACLCCVEKTDEGHVCVCTEGPVFNIEKLLW
ncbi:MAG: dihydroorotate dehydrogenase electron transfer subunit, partial [Muribaculaceae bacterium]|nr:dihydroorotate dehydrogenase electron transfer subunit [Muribaculaceae bacterium]